MHDLIPLIASADFAVTMGVARFQYGIRRIDAVEGLANGRLHRYAARTHGQSHCSRCANTKADNFALAMLIGFFWWGIFPFWLIWKAVTHNPPAAPSEIKAATEARIAAKVAERKKRDDRIKELEAERALYPERAHVGLSTPEE